MMKFRQNLIKIAIGTIMAAACLGPMIASADEVVTYDMSDFENMSGRTEEDVKEKYLEALKAGETYIEGDSSTYYTTPASTKAPYSAGVLSEDSLENMEAMSNFYRWIIGAEPLTTNTISNTSLQTQALDRNFEFAHEISEDSKPDDMDQELWDEGFESHHNILNWCYSPTEAIRSWMNEGYSLSTSKWGQYITGHRLSILDTNYSSITYGYSGRVAIGDCGELNNTFDNAFAAYPSGFFPTQLIDKSCTAWDCQLNTSIVKVTNASDIIVTVTDMTDGTSYECTSANGYAYISTAYVAFRQPSESSSYKNDYRIDITGLTDVATGSAAKVTYTVNFFSLGKKLGYTSLTLERDLYAYTGAEITPTPIVKYNGTVLKEGSDYEVSYLNNTDIGKGMVWVTGKGQYFGVCKKYFTIREDKKILDECTVSIASCTYTGTALTPAVTVTNYGDILEEGKDYTLKYSNNIEPGNGTIELTGIGEYSGSQTKEFTINKKSQTLTYNRDAMKLKVGGTGTITVHGIGNITYQSLNEDVLVVEDDGTVHGVAAGSTYVYAVASGDAYYDKASLYVSYSVANDDKLMSTCSVATSSAIYTGSEVTPTIVVKYFNDTLTEGTDYTLTCSNNINPGTGTITITGIGDYSGSVTHNFTIYKKSQSISISRNASTLKVGGTDKITATGVGDISYTSSNENIITVDAEGNVQALSSGSATICVKASGDDYTNSSSSSCTYTVKEDNKLMTSCVVTVDTARYTGNALKPAVTVKYFDDVLTEGTDYIVTYSNNVTPGTGTATITGKGDYSGSVSHNFTIYKATQTFSAKLNKYTLEVGEITNITASGVGNITYTSKNTSILTVDATGAVHAIGTGTAYIYVTAAGNDCYNSASTSFRITVSADIHSMVEKDVTYANGSDNIATITKKCSVCGKEETNSFTTMTEFLLGWWIGESGSYTYSTSQVEGTTMRVSLEYKAPTDAENKDLIVTSSDESIAKVNGRKWTFVGTGTVTITISAKYNPSVKESATFVVSHALGDEGTVVTQATCVKKQQTSYVCTYCGETVIVDGVVDASNHVGKTYMSNVSAATCTADGYTGDKCCSDCKAVITSGSSIPAIGHKVVTDAAVAATCTTTGLTEGSHCSACNEILTAQETVKALGHSYTSKITTAATCTTAGVRTYTCKRCGYTYTKKIAAKGHTVVTDAAVTATCTTTGLTEGSHCSVCNEVLTAQEIVAALGHKKVADAAVAATCTTTGLTKGYHCANCGKIMTAQKMVAAKGHTVVVDEAVAATCTTTGLTEGSHCSVCNAVLTAQKTVAALGHTEVTDPAVAATYTATGLTEGSHCSVCGEILVPQETVAKLTLTKITVATATNTTSGVTITWNKVAEAEGYRIYRKIGSGSYTLYTKITSADTTTYTDTAVTSGTTYTYAVRAYVGSTYGAYTGKTIKYLAPATISALTNYSAGIQVKWSKVTGATGYYVYRKAGSATKWSKVATVTSGSTVKWNDTSTSSGLKYQYCVKAYSGSYTAAYKGVTTYRVTTPTISSVTNSAAGKATVKWNKNTSATGYQISYTTGSTTKTVTVSGNTNVSKVISGLTKGKTYTVKVRSYRKVGTTYYYSTWSSAKSVKITK